MTAVRVPASSANLGPGFDALGMALSLYAEVGVVGDDEPPPTGPTSSTSGTRRTSPSGGPAATGELWVRSPIPAGRGLGFSGAMRVGGLVAAVVQRRRRRRDARRGSADAARAGRRARGSRRQRRRLALRRGGGDGGRTGRARPARRSSRRSLVWVPAVRDVDAPLAPRPRRVGGVRRRRVQRRAHGAARRRPGGRRRRGAALGDRRSPAPGPALRRRRPGAHGPGRGLEAGAWCGWLSGSGPTVCLLCAPADAEALAAALPADGHTKHLDDRPRRASPSPLASRDLIPLSGTDGASEAGWTGACGRGRGPRRRGRGGVGGRGSAGRAAAAGRAPAVEPATRTSTSRARSTTHVTSPRLISNEPRASSSSIWRVRLIAPVERRQAVAGHRRLLVALVGGEGRHPRRSGARRRRRAGPRWPRRRAPTASS